MSTPLKFMKLIVALCLIAAAPLLFAKDTKNAEDTEGVEITSIEAAEGVGLSCHPDGDLMLGIFGESGKIEIMATKEEEYIHLIVTRVKYSFPVGVLATDDTPTEPFEVFTQTTHTFFHHGKLLPWLYITEEEQNENNQSYQLLQQALGEAHEQRKCLNWHL